VLNLPSAKIYSKLNSALPSGLHIESIRWSPSTLRSKPPSIGSLFWGATYEVSPLDKPLNLSSLVDRMRSQLARLDMHDAFINMATAPVSVTLPGNRGREGGLLSILQVALQSDSIFSAIRVHKKSTLALGNDGLVLLQDAI
jgi:hypothetical protein